jgi:hypothetical protein
MSYLTRYATRALGGVRLEPGVRVDEYTRLNLPGFYGDAFVRVFVEDTSRRNARRGVSEPKLRLRIADCTNVINLEFSVESALDRKNSLFKIDTLLGALERFRDGLRAEAELHAERARR